MENNYTYTSIFFSTLILKILKNKDTVTRVILVNMATWRKYIDNVTTIAYFNCNIFNELLCSYVTILFRRPFTFF